MQRATPENRVIILMKSRMTTGSGLTWRDWSTEAFAAAPAVRASAAAGRHLLVGGLPAPRAAGADRTPTSRVPSAIASSACASTPIAVPTSPTAMGCGDWPTLVVPHRRTARCVSGGTDIDAPTAGARARPRSPRPFAARRDEHRAAGAGGAQRAARACRRPRRHGAGDRTRARRRAWAAAQLRGAFDDDLGGFWRGPKRAAGGAGGLCADARRRGPAIASCVEMAVRTLDRLGWSDLSDATTGAFNRACRRARTGPTRIPRVCSTSRPTSPALFLDATVSPRRGRLRRTRARGDRLRAGDARRRGGRVLQQPGRTRERARPGRSIPHRRHGVQRALGADAAARGGGAAAPRYGELALAAIERSCRSPTRRARGGALPDSSGSPRVARSARRSGGDERGPDRSRAGVGQPGVSRSSPRS